MQKPANAAAEEISRLLSINSDIDEQIRVLRETQSRNRAIAETLADAAQWTETDEPESSVEPVIVIEEA